MKYMDLHCDALTQGFLSKRSDIATMDNAMVDLDRQEQGGCIGQFFAMFMPPNGLPGQIRQCLPGG